MKKNSTILPGMLFIAGMLFSLMSFGRAPQQAPGDSSVIYIYRTGQFNGAGTNWAIFVDGQKICKISNNRFMQITVAPGKHRISAKIGGANLFKKETEVEIEAETGGSYYVACNIKQSITRSRLEMLEVTKSTASKQMEGMQLDKCQEKIDKED